MRCHRRLLLVMLAVLLPGVVAIVPTAVETAPAAASSATGDGGQITGGSGFSCSLTAAGGVKCWGANTFGNLGDGTDEDRSTPVPVDGLESGAVAVSAGIDHACALTDTGGVKCWGLNNRGQLGDGTTTNRSTPVDVVGLGSGVTALAAGNLHTCAIIDTGGVKCWGTGGNGQLGDGDKVNRSTPVDVVGLTSPVTAIAPGANHTCLLTDAGGVKCWGSNTRGGVGDGTTIERATPVDVVGLDSGVTAISAYGNLGGQRSCAVTSAGGLKCWGDNSSAQLGDGTTTNRLTPVDVVGLSSGIVSVTTGYSETCARTDAGGVKCWGAFGIGDGVYSGDLRTTPVDVIGLASGVDEIDAGHFHVCAVKSSGGVTCWGANDRGQLGQGLAPSSWPEVGRIPRDVSGSFFRDECPTLVPEPHTDHTMTDGYGVGSTVTYVADAGYTLDGPATLTCQSDLTWDGVPPAVTSAGTVVVVPDTGLSGGDTVEVQLSGFAPRASLGWAQCIVLDTPSQDNCSEVIALGSADDTGSLTALFVVQRFIHVAAADRWVDCTDPAEACVIGAADITDIPASAVSGGIDFAEPPAPPATRGTIALSPADIGTAGQAVTVTGSGFRSDTQVDVFQCTADPVHPDDCNLAVASTTTDGAGGFTLDVTVVAAVQPPGGAPTDCFAVLGTCAIAAAEAVDFPATVVAVPVSTPPRVIPGGVVVIEGDTGTRVMEVPVRLSSPTTQTVTVEWTTIFEPTWSELAAVPGVDYGVASGTVTFAPGQTDQTVPVTINADTTTEPDELLVVSFRHPTNARMGGFYGLGFGLIANDDPLPMVIPGSTVEPEGDTGTRVMEVPVTLSNPSSTAVTVQWSTVFDPGWGEVAADPGVDYEAASGTVTFTPGQTDQTVPVTINADTDSELDELVVVSFHDPVNAQIGGFGLGLGLIADDDPP